MIVARWARNHSGGQRPVGINNTVAALRLQTLLHKLAPEIGNFHYFKIRFKYHVILHERWLLHEDMFD